MNIKAFISFEDYETGYKVSQTDIFKSVAEAQAYVISHNDNDIFSIIRDVKLYKNDEYIGKISQNGRFWPVRV